MAIADFTAALQVDPKYVAALVERGNTYDDNGDPTNAIRDYDEAIRLDPKHANAYANRGVTNSRMGNLNAAIADFNEAIRLAPKKADTYCHRGRAYRKRQEFDKAIADFAEAIRLDPQDDMAYRSRAWAYRSTHQYDKAIADCDEAVRLCPKVPYNYEFRAALRIGQGDYQAGIDDLHRVLEINPNDPAAKFESWLKQPLTSAALRQGEEQVRRMLHDRPKMAQFGEKAEVLQKWAARKFAGEDLCNVLVWDATEPADAVAQSRPPTSKRPGEIRVRKTLFEGATKGKDVPFETLWSAAVFELYNVMNAKDFDLAEDEVIAGRLTKREFTAKIADCEYHAAEKTRAFYIHVFLPWAKDEGVSTDPHSWYVGDRSDSGISSTLARLDKKGAYWKHNERIYDLILLRQLALRGQSDHVLTLAATLANDSITNEQKAVLQLYRGMAFAHQGDQDKAISEFSAAIRNRPNLSRAYRHRGVAYGSHPWEAVSASFFSLGGMEGNNSLSSFELYFIGDNE